MSSPASPQSDKTLGTAYRKPRPDVFTVLLVLALLAILFSTALLWSHMTQIFDRKIKGGPVPATIVACDGTAVEGMTKLG